MSIMIEGGYSYTISQNELKMVQLNSSIKIKSRLMYLQIFTFVIWNLAAITNVIAGNNFASAMNLFCVLCWGFLSYQSVKTVQDLKQEKQDIINIQNKEKEKDDEIKALDFFHKNG
jgi:hypothetical protein